MIVDNVLILFTSNPACPQLLTAVRLIEAQGWQVFLQSLQHLHQERKPVVKPAIKASLALIQPN